jgi:hemolysin III
VLVLSAPSGLGAAGGGDLPVSVAALSPSIALYQRVRWRSSAARRSVRRLDHSMIFVLIADTYTPFTLIAARCAARSLVRR